MLTFVNDIYFAVVFIMFSDSQPKDTTVKD